jgi:hypothetical protein
MQGFWTFRAAARQPIRRPVKAGANEKTLNVKTWLGSDQPSVARMTGAIIK